MQQDGESTYLHGYHLGSTVMTTDASGNGTAQKYYAFGYVRDGGGLAMNHTFTGQKADGTGLMYYNARYYDPEIGQFISPDSIVPDPTNVFAYNRYLYVRRNPLKYLDPSGHCALSDGGSRYIVNDGECWTRLDDFIKLGKADPEYFHRHLRMTPNEWLETQETE